MFNKKKRKEQIYTNKPHFYKTVVVREQIKVKNNNNNSLGKKVNNTECYKRCCAQSFK